MTDLQLFAFLVMPFLFVLSCSMVFFSHGRKKPDKAADPPEPVARPRTYIRKPRKQQAGAHQADAAEE